MAMIQIREALRQAMCEEMRRDESIFLMGEEVAHYNGAYKVSQGMLEEFGEDRVVDTPISENGFAGLGIGAAMVGMRPIIEFMTWNFSLVAFDQVVNSASKIYQMSGGQYSVPIVFRGPNGLAENLGSQHSTSVDSLYAHFPGLKVVTYATAYDAKGLLKAAIRDPNPVVFLESELTYGIKGEVPDEEYVIPLGKADIKRPGKDVTLITWGKQALQRREGCRATRCRGHRRRDRRSPIAAPARPRDRLQLRRENRARGRHSRGLPLRGCRCGDYRPIQEACFDILGSRPAGRQPGRPPTLHHQS